METNHAIETFFPLRDKVKSLNTVADGGFHAQDAKELLELCIELNNQDDRTAMPDIETFKAQLTDWKLVFDSREQNNNDVKTNGFKPLNNAWLLAQSESHPDQFAIAIRGTVSEFTSILADAYASSIPAYAGIEYPKNHNLPIVFAATPGAEVHLGFAYAAFSLLFEQDNGILAQLKNRHIEKLYITGHSQGAAVATLIHAFLYYGILDPQNRYSLDFLSNTTLKSYLFAQPKPGNLQFAQDFARISKDFAFVINNDRDPVPQVPLSLETVSEVAAYIEQDNEAIPVGSAFTRIVQDITNAKNTAKGAIADIFTDRVADKFAAADVHVSVNDYFKNVPDLNPARARSLNYTLAGQLIPVFGQVQGGALYPNSSGKPDILLQHHATSYRQLLKSQL